MESSSSRQTTRAVGILIMTAPRRLPERLPLLQRTLRAALRQELPAETRLDVWVLDDGPGAGKVAKHAF